jgi:hypothetical protein
MGPPCSFNILIFTHPFVIAIPDETDAAWQKRMSHVRHHVHDMGTIIN